jgi:serine protease AprX
MKNLLTVIFILVAEFVSGQSVPCWIFFKDKTLSGLDATINANYVRTVSEHCDSVGVTSKWLNAVAAYVKLDQVEVVRSLTFVDHVEVVAVNAASYVACRNTDTTLKNDTNYYHTQLKPFGKTKPVDFGVTGKGITIAVFDIGFRGVNTHPAFAHVRKEGRIKATYDFVLNQTNVDHKSSSHGTAVLSCIVGKVEGVNLGYAPDATVLLARIAREGGNQFKSEQNFVRALEWADSLGANIINMSGGPNERSYFAEQMDGKTALISRAANIAARKGILVVAAAGNNGEFDEEWNILPPGDADSALCVTALDESGKYGASYSSYGPTADFRRKPDICAPGTALVAQCNLKGTCTYGWEEGTSFAAPFVSGLAACVMQIYPDSGAMAVYQMLQRRASLYPYYDYLHGYGVPQTDSLFLDTGYTTGRDSIPTGNDDVTVEKLADAFTFTARFKDQRKNSDYLFVSIKAGDKVVYYAVHRVTSCSEVRVKLREEWLYCKMVVRMGSYYAELDL